MAAQDDLPQALTLAFPPEGYGDVELPDWRKAKPGRGWTVGEGSSANISHMPVDWWEGPDFWTSTHQEPAPSESNPSRPASGPKFLLLIHVQAYTTRRNTSLKEEHDH